ncbi:natterin-1 [Anolis carolinensis]|uniref:Natterin-3-like n=1 Tax=Anolis carolinensis TaxID=28377 RepID=R4GAB4_ANOCA|nr:PREDICTED: natterin-1 [Anolis carolinensis]|eukprot:XP_008114656.1 PREDICTED: natterin-1 [Anolis carolinensis]
MQLLLCILLIPLIASEQGNSGVNVTLRILSRTVEKLPPVIPVPEKGGNQATRYSKKNKRQDTLGNEAFQGTSLKWVPFQGNISQEAVSLWNDYAQRTEYICATEVCRVGFYSPKEGLSCFYTFEGKQNQSARFWLLVNENTLELLEWQSGYAGSVPSNAIGTCSGDRFYVGKNKYGLGEVDRQNGVFFIPMDGSGFWYKSYKILTINKDYTSQHIYDVKYFTESGVYGNKTVTLKTSKVRNYDCKVVKKKASLSKEVDHEHHWDFSHSLSLTKGYALTAGIPRIIGGCWSISTERHVTQFEGSSETEREIHTVDVELEVQPNHECKVEMEGIQMKSEIPFSASVIRYYKNGMRQRGTIQGISRNLVVEEINTIIKRCRPIPNAEPCDDYD